MSTLAVCVCVFLHVCVYVCVCVSLLRLTTEYCKQIHQLSVYICMCVVACNPATFRTNKMNRFVWHYFVIQQPHLYAAMRAISVAHFRANFISVLLLQSPHNLPIFVAH